MFVKPQERIKIPRENHLNLFQVPREDHLEFVCLKEGLFELLLDPKEGSFEFVREFEGGSFLLFGFGSHPWFGLVFLSPTSTSLNQDLHQHLTVQH